MAYEYVAVWNHETGHRALVRPQYVKDWTDKPDSPWKTAKPGDEVVEKYKTKMAEFRAKATKENK